MSRWPPSTCSSQSRARSGWLLPVRGGVPLCPRSPPWTNGVLGTALFWKTKHREQFPFCYNCVFQAFQRLTLLPVQVWRRTTTTAAACKDALIKVFPSSWRLSHPTDTLTFIFRSRVSGHLPKVIPIFALVFYLRFHHQLSNGFEHSSSFTSELLTLCVCHVFGIKRLNCFSNDVKWL